MADEKSTRTKELAYELWEREGRPQGRQVEHWLEAERRLARDRQGPADAGRQTTVPSQPTSAAEARPGEARSNETRTGAPHAEPTSAVEAVPSQATKKPARKARPKTSGGASASTAATEAGGGGKPRRSRTKSG